MGKFDMLTRGLASGGLSRRESLKLAVASAGAAMLSAVGVAGAAADNSPDPEVLCGTCRGTSSACGSLSGCSGCANGSCLCFGVVGRPRNKCGCTDFCSNLATCSSNTDCSRGHYCSTNCCDQSAGFGFTCVQKCKPGTTCPSRPTGTGAMNARAA
ncbi:MAG TPA: hypothetical protein VFZ25_01315 [Chloroflexota bacterium]|nr:hypothetical protein [Chloroflexota bacterium]